MVKKLCDYKISETRSIFHLDMAEIESFCGLNVNYLKKNVKHPQNAPLFTISC